MLLTTLMVSWSLPLNYRIHRLNTIIVLFNYLLDLAGYRWFQNQFKLLLLHGKQFALRDRKVIVRAHQVANAASMVKSRAVLCIISSPSIAPH